jgi:hypothetical protein
VIFNRTSEVVENRPRLPTAETYDVLYGDSYVSVYRDIMATNQTFINANGDRQPLWYKHRLPDGAVDVRLEVVTNGNRLPVVGGYVVDVGAGKVFTNYRNQFDSNTGAYVLYWLLVSLEDGSTITQLLAPEAAAREAQWEDIDLDTGSLRTDYPLYVRDEGVGTNTFDFNVVDTWYVRESTDSLIQPLAPMALNAERPWFVRFTNGEFVAYVDSAARRYRIPEYELQPFSPVRPYIFMPFEKLEIVNGRVLKAPRDRLAIIPGLHVTVYAHDYAGDLVKVITSDESLWGSRYGNSSVLYESGIAGADNVGGFIALGLDLDPSWQVSASYYYEADDFEYTGIDLNPVLNKSVRDKLVVFYLIPDVEDGERALHHLVVDKDGVIVEASQPDMQLWISPGVVNTDTAIGVTYEVWIATMAPGGTESAGYMLLAEVHPVSSADQRDCTIVSVRREGGVPVSTEVIARSPAIQHSLYGGNPEGFTVPKDRVVVIEIPLYVLEDYGGWLTQDRAIQAATAHLDIATYPVVRWVYPQVRLSGTRTNAGEATLRWKWQGPGIYRLYRKTSLVSSWELVTTVTQNTEPGSRNMSYVNTGLSSGVYYWGVSVEEGAVEYPVPYAFGLEV